MFVLFANRASAQYLEFVENKGQWDDKVHFKANISGGSVYLQANGYKAVMHNGDDIKEIAEFFGGHVHGDSLVKKSGTSNPGNIFHVRSHAYEVKFLNALPQAQVQPEKYQNTYNNYFIGKDSSKWAAHCRLFSAVSYKNIYKNVDVRYYAEKGNLKYDLIVNPGADINKIALQFAGAEKLSVNKNGNLIIKTSIGEAYELKPYTYQVTEQGKTVVDAKFEVSDNIVRFKVGNYLKNATLIIDPSLIFSTFTGSRADNWGYTATYDNAGNFYAGGIAFSDGYPVSNGAYDETFNGGDNSENVGPYDIAIMKLSSNGSQRLYATYIGGSGTEQPHSMIVDLNGDLVFSGRTTSTNFPITVTNYGPGGGFDIFLGKLNADGTKLLSSRKFGGAGSDGVNIQPKYSTLVRGASATRRNYGDDARSEVLTDNNDNIYLASCTQSADFPTSPNAVQKALKGKQDGVLIKTSPDLGAVYTCTYLGGNGDDAAFVLTLNPTNNNIYVAGGTTSTDFSRNASNADGILSTSFKGGECDGFVSIFSNDGSVLIKTTYVGTTGNDLVYGIQFDKKGFPYVTGTTTVSFPLKNVAFTSQANGKQFITKFQQDLSGVVYSANFGKGLSVPDISPTAFLVDVCENVYVSGWGGGINTQDGYPNANTYDLSLTPNAISKITDGADFYFFVLEKNGLSQLFGSYFGTDARNDPSVLGDHVDGGTSRFDRRGTIYQAICANCGQNGVFPTTAGVWSPGNPSQNGSKCNEAAVKIALELAGVISSIQTSINGRVRDSSGCIPLTVQFTDTLNLGTSYKWDFGDGSSPVVTTQPTISHTFNLVGNYRVMLVSRDSATCNIADTSYVLIKAKDNKAQVQFTETKLLPCDSLNYQFNNTSIAPPGLPFGANSFTWDFGDGTTLVSNAPFVQHTYAAPGTYNVKLLINDTTYCNAPDSAVLQLRASPLLVAQFNTPPSGCLPYSAMFTNTSLGGNKFVWDFGDGTTSTDVNPTHLYNAAGTYTVTLSATDPNTCNPQDDTTMTIQVFPGPVASFQFGPVPPKENEPIQFINFSSGGQRFRWDFGDGDTLITFRTDTTVNHIYNKTGTYKVCLTAYNDQSGCSDDTCQEISAVVMPLLDVPNAFSPNGDNINDVIRVRGYGVEKMTWRIYNRWGVLVFQSNSVSNGWDGKVNGVLQPMDVYAYVLDVTFSDNKVYRKKGDITLLR